MQIRQVQNPPPPLPKRKRVAAYARVSDGKEAMLHSLSAQVSYYSGYIGKYPEWEYAGVYADEAFTGTKENRPGFQKMLAEARAGNIQMILTKSISRFARNTITVLESVRELKAIGVDIFFEEQNIHSLSAEGEVMLTILASYAQEESRSASENQKWRVRKNFREGKVWGTQMLGYHQVRGVLAVIPEEAELVRAVFADYLSGMGIIAIMKKYRAQGVQFSKSGLANMLRNEKYAGDLLLQKTFSENHITKKRIINIGQLPQYFVTDSHEPIIDRDTFAAVQAEISRRSANFTKKPLAVYPFTGLIRCGKCGAPYKRKHANAGGKYEKIVWICTTFDTLGKGECDSQQIPEALLEEKTAEAGGLDGIAGIIAAGHNALEFIFKDGQKVQIGWENPSRRHSWTPEMREAARQKTLARYRKEAVL